MKRIKELRVAKRVKQKDLAEMLNITQGTLSNWETSRHDPDTESLLFLAKYFEVPTDYLLGVSNTPPQQKKEPTAHDELVQEFAELIKSVPPEKLPKVKNLLFPTVDAIKG